MAHLEVLTPHTIQDPDLRAMLLASGDEMFGVYGHCPEACKAFLQFYRPLKYGGTLPFALTLSQRLLAQLIRCRRSGTRFASHQQQTALSRDWLSRKHA